MGRGATKAAGNVWYEARMEAAKWNDKLLSRAGAAEALNMSEDAVKDAELGLNKCMPVSPSTSTDACARTHTRKSVPRTGTSSPQRRRHKAAALASSCGLAEKENCCKTHSKPAKGGGFTLMQ